MAVRTRLLLLSLPLPLLGGKKEESDERLKDRRVVAVRGLERVLGAGGVRCSCKMRGTSAGEVGGRIVMFVPRQMRRSGKDGFILCLRT